MIRREEPEKRSYVTPDDDEALLFVTEDGWRHQSYPAGESEDPEYVAHNLLSINPETGERITQPVEVPRSRITEAKEFVIRHRKGEAAAAVSVGAIVVGSLFVRRIRKKHK